MSHLGHCDKEKLFSKAGHHILRTAVAKSSKSPLFFSWSDFLRRSQMEPSIRQYLYHKKNSRIFIIRNLSKCRCPPSLIMKSHCAFILSIYGYPCLCNSPSYMQKRLIRVEKRVSRIIGERMFPALSEAADKSCEQLMS